MLYENLDPSLFALICDAAGLDAETCANALEVICGDLDTDAEALTWIYQTGTLVVGRMCRESYEDAHDPECDAAPAVCLYEMNGGQLIAVCGVRAFLELQCSAVDFALDAAAILADDVQDWELERCDADRVAADLAHPETRFIATFSLPAGLALTDSQPGVAGLAYLGDGVEVLAGIWEYEHSGVGDLFVGVMPCGISYCDRTREEGGDFVRLAFLSYATLTLVWRTAPAALKPGLRWAVEDDAACLIARRGEAFFIDSRGCKSVILGDGG